LTLPNNRNVVVLAVTLQSATAVTATVKLNPAPGNFTTAQSVSLTDDTAGAVIYYTIDGSMPTTKSAIYKAPLQVSSTTTINAIAAAPGYSTSAPASGTYTFGTASTISVNLATPANVYAIATNGATVPGTGIDGGGYAYSATLLGPSASWSGVNFALGAPQALDAVSNTTLILPVGNFAKLYMLATGVNGNQPNQNFVVTYTDATTTTLAQSLSDWFTPQNYAGESKALTEAYRLNATGATDKRTFYLYGYGVAINPAKTVKSLTLPKNVNAVVLSLTLSQ
jgi:hypothetical protein